MWTAAVLSKLLRKNDILLRVQYQSGEAHGSFFVKKNIFIINCKLINYFIIILKIMQDLLIKKINYSNSQF